MEVLRLRACELASGRGGRADYEAASHRPSYVVGPVRSPHVISQLAQLLRVHEIVGTQLVAWPSPAR
jgi:hypothetical protein